jgi:uncharacterized protein (DUF433 family)
MQPYFWGRIGGIMTESLQFTAAEAAFVLQEPVRAVKKALDEGPVRPVLVRRAGASVRAIGWMDLFYLFAIRNLREELTPKALLELYEALQHKSVEHVREVRFGRLRVVLTDLVEEIEKRTRRLSELAEEVEFRGDGEPLLRGTTIEVYRIAALIEGGMSFAEIRRDYPSLAKEQIRTAKAYADAHPKPGRPYPRVSVKQAMRNVGLEALDEVLDDSASR